LENRVSRRLERLAHGRLLKVRGPQAPACAGDGRTVRGRVRARPCRPSASARGQRTSRGRCKGATTPGRAAGVPAPAAPCLRHHGRIGVKRGAGTDRELEEPSGGGAGWQPMSDAGDLRTDLLAAPLPPTWKVPAVRGELLRRAAELVPVLKARATRCENLRQIPPESVRDLLTSELIRIGNPQQYGGHGVEIDLAHEVAWELARGCGSTGWCYSLGTVHNWWLGHFPERAQEEFFANGPDTLFSSGLNPASGVAEPVHGGFRLSGRWTFSSGCDAAQWAM